jgi:hypothetical protein
MRLQDVPKHPAYVVSHDEYDRGAMDVWPCVSIERATEIAKQKQDHLDNNGLEGAHYRAYEKLPRVKVWKFHDTILS